MLIRADDNVVVDTIVRDVTDDIDDKIFELFDGITPQLTEQELGEFTGIFKGRE